MSRFSAITVVLLLTIGCGKTEESPVLEDSSDPCSVSSATLSTWAGPNVQYDATVSPNCQALLRKDLSVIGQLSSLPESSADAQVMGVANFSGGELLRWISERIRFVVGETFAPENSWQITKNTSAYPPVMVADIDFSMEEVSAVILMANIGAAVYLKGKNSSSVIDVNVAGQNVRVHSPRVGIFQVGPGLFGANNRPSGSSADSLAARYSRLATLFHEARHDDGNGTNAAFTHAKCPSTHELKDEYACDSKTNGPYVIEAMMLKKFYLSCSSCSEAEKDFLLLRYADDSSRQLSDATWADPTPEQIR